MKFNRCITNPPFNSGPGKGDLHLRIMEKCVTACDKCIVLAPIWWFGYTDEAKACRERYMWSIGAAIKKIEYMSPESSDYWFKGECKNSSLGIYIMGGTNLGFLGFQLFDKYKPQGEFCLSPHLMHGEFTESILNTKR